MKKLLLLVVFILSFIFWNNSAFCQTKNPLLDDGIKQYQEENYEEAIEVLEKLQTKGPQSSLAAYFLGMAYKQTQDYVKAAANLEVALTLPPAVKEALVEQVNILFQLDRLAEAKKWIAVAKKENIAPANISFLEGMILARERKYSAAIDSFERAKTLDKNLVPTADYQIGLCFLNDKKFKSARERFKATASYDPQSDLATYARQYMDAVENTLFYTRPLRVTLGISGGYDSNVTSKPRHESVAGGAGNPETGVFSPSVRLEFVPQLESNWLFNAMFYSTANFNQNYVHSRDSVSSTFSVIPGYNFGRFSISMLGSYTNYLLRTDPDTTPDGNANLKHYEDYFTFGPIFKMLLTEKQIVELFAGYDKKNYYNQAFTSNDNLRDAEGVRAYLSWVWFFLDNGFINLRYEVANEAANGSYWDNTCNRFSANLVLPLLPADYIQKIGFVYLQLAGSYTLQDYSHPQPYSELDGSAKTDKRKDDIYNGSASLNWDITKNWSCFLQYAHTKTDSNIPAYEYTRNLYLAGLEFKF